MPNMKDTLSGIGSKFANDFVKQWKDTKPLQMRSNLGHSRLQRPTQQQVTELDTAAAAIRNAEARASGLYTAGDPASADGYVDAIGHFRPWFGSEIPLTKEEKNRQFNIDLLDLHDKSGGMKKDKDRKFKLSPGLKRALGQIQSKR